MAFFKSRDLNTCSRSIQLAPRNHENDDKVGVAPPETGFLRAHTVDSKNGAARYFKTSAYRGNGRKDAQISLNPDKIRRYAGRGVPNIGKGQPKPQSISGMAVSK